VALKHAHPALGDGQYGGALALLDVGNDTLFGFSRTLGADPVHVVVDVTRDTQAFRLGAVDRTLPGSGWLIEACRALVAARPLA
jgi:hypothetical protein